MGFWSAAASAIGGLFGLGGNLIQSNLANKWNHKQLDAQIAENEKNRQFNHNESMAARNFQANFAREMYERQLKDNSIQNQISQMRSAGVNPALAYSSNSFAPASSSSVSAGGASSSGGVSPTQYATTDMATPALSTARQVAEIANIEAQTKKLSSETDILQSDAKFRDAWNSGNLILQGLTISHAENQLKIDDDTSNKLRAEVANIQKETESLDKTMKLVDTQIESGALDNIGKRIDNYYKSDQYEALIDQIHSQTGKNKAEIRSVLSKLPYEIANIKSETGLNNAKRVSENFNRAVMSSMAKLYNANAEFTITNNSISNIHLNDVSDMRRIRESLGPVTGGLFATRDFLSGLFGISYSVSSKM